MRPRLLIAGILQALACAGTVSGCALAQSFAPPPRPAPLPVTPAAAARTPAQYRELSTDLETRAQAAGNTAPARELWLQAAEAAAFGGDGARARRMLDHLPAGSLDAPQQARAQLARARSELLEGHAREALHALPQNTSGSPLAAQVEELRARALFDLGDPALAVRALVDREALLAQPADLARNHELIWNGLLAAQLNDSVLARAGAEGPAVRGWVELALLSRNRADAATLEAWRERYPEHPGAERLGILAASAPERAAPVTPLSFSAEARAGSIALVLPGGGSFAATAEAVRDGFLAAKFDAGAADTVQIYDAGGTADTAVAAYQHALNDGAAFIVGPLTKDGVAAVANLGQPPVPVLALNYLDDPRLAPFNFFQFGLAPEDEARAAADHAVSQGLRRAVAMVPSTDWGDRVLAAFDRRLRELGGAVVAQGRYAQGALDLSKSIEGLLGTAQSEERHRELTSILGKKSEFDPRRRDDIDIVFFAARPQEARLIWPQFRFHRASELAVYATSLVYDGGAEPELNGVRFCDMPWMLDSQGDAATLRAQSADFASQKAYPRLFAFGYDAFRLAAQVRAGSLRPEQSLAAATGRLNISGGVITRGLSCAQIVSGGLKPLESPLVTAP